MYGRTFLGRECLGLCLGKFSGVGLIFHRGNVRGMSWVGVRIPCRSTSLCGCDFGYPG